MIKKEYTESLQISNICLTNIARSINIYYIVKIRRNFFEDFRQ